MLDWLLNHLPDINRQALALALVHSLWQCTLIAGLAWGILKGIPSRHANARYWVSTLALIAMVAAFAATWRIASVTFAPLSQAVAQISDISNHQARLQTDSDTLQRLRKELSDATDAIKINSQPNVKPQPGSLAKIPQVTESPTAKTDLRPDETQARYEQAQKRLTEFLSNLKPQTTLRVSPAVTTQALTSSPWLAPFKIPAALVPWANGFWFAGVFLMLARLSWATSRAIALKRSSSPINFGEEFDLFTALLSGLPRTPKIRLAVSSQVHVPCVIGWLWPVILLPARGLSMLPKDDLKLILAHELAHVRRFDGLVNLLQCLVEAILFFNPAVWWINRVIRQEREACCDAAAVSQNHASIENYATALLHWGELAAASHASQPALALTGPVKHKLVDRVKRLLIPDKPPELTAPLWSLPLLLSLAAAFFVGIETNQAQTTPKPTTQPKSPATSTSQPLGNTSETQAENKKTAKAFIRKTQELLKEGRKDGAIMFLESAFALDPENPDIKDQLKQLGRPIPSSRLPNQQNRLNSDEQLQTVTYGVAAIIHPAPGAQYSIDELAAALKRAISPQAPLTILPSAAKSGESKNFLIVTATVRHHLEVRHLLTNYVNPKTLTPAQLDEKINGLFNSIALLRQQWRYDEALCHVNEILFLKPDDTLALGLKKTLQDARLATPLAPLATQPNTQFLPLAPTPKPATEPITAPATQPQSTGKISASPEQIKKTVDAFMKKALQLLQEGNKDGAAIFLEGALQLDPENAQAKDQLKRLGRSPSATSPKDLEAIRKPLQLDEQIITRSYYVEPILNPPSGVRVSLDDLIHSLTRIIPAYAPLSITPAASKPGQPDDVLVVKATKRHQMEIGYILQHFIDINTLTPAQLDEKIQGMLKAIQVLRKEQKYDEALSQVNHILFLKPNDPAALFIKEMIEEARIITLYQKSQPKAQFIPLAPAATPPAEPINAPATQPAPVPQTAEAILANPAPDLDFQQTPLSTAINELRTKSRLLIDVNWPALEEKGITKKTPITLKTHGLTWGQTFDKLIAQATPPNAKLNDRVAWALINNIVRITTRPLSLGDLDSRLYDIGDLLDPNGKFQFTPARLTAAIVNKVGERQDWNLAGEPGPNIASMRHLRSDIIVRAPVSFHKQLLQLLADIRSGGISKDTDFGDTTGLADLMNASLSANEGLALRARINQLQSQYPHPSSEHTRLTTPVKVRLVTSDGSPLPTDAKPIVFSFGGWDFDGSPSVDAQGIWTVNVGPGHYGITAGAAGYWAYYYGPAWSAPGNNMPVNQPITITLTACPLREIKFADPSGNPVYPAELQFETYVSSGSLFSNTAQFRPILHKRIHPTPGQPIRIPLPDSGDTYVHVIAPGYRSGKYAFRLSELSPTATITLEHSPNIAGQVIDAATGQAVPNAIISLSDSDGFRQPSPPQSISDASGKFTFDMFEPQPQTIKSKQYRSMLPIWASAPGYGPEPVQIDDDGKIPAQTKLTRSIAIPVEVTGDLSRLPGYPNAPMLAVRYNNDTPVRNIRTHNLYFPITIKDGRGTGVIQAHANMKTIVETLAPGLWGSSAPSYADPKQPGVTTAVRQTLDPAVPLPPLVRIHIPAPEETRRVRIALTGVPKEVLTQTRAWAKCESALAYWMPHKEPPITIPLTIDADGTATLAAPIYSNLTLFVEGFPGDYETWPTAIIPGEGELKITHHLDPTKASGGLFGQVLDSAGKPLPSYILAASAAGAPFSDKYTGGYAIGTAQGFAFPQIALDSALSISLCLPDQPGKYIRVTGVQSSKTWPIPYITIQLQPDGTARLVTPGGSDPHDLTRNTGQYSLQIASFTKDTPDKNHAAAVALASQLRAQGEDAYSFLDPELGVGSVTVGSFTSDDLIESPPNATAPAESTGRTLQYGGRISDLRKRFPTLTLNNAPAAATSPGSVLIQVPKPGKSR